MSNEFPPAHSTPLPKVDMWLSQWNPSGLEWDGIGLTLVWSRNLGEIGSGQGRENTYLKQALGGGVWVFWAVLGTGAFHGFAGFLAVTATIISGRVLLLTGLFGTRKCAALDLLVLPGAQHNIPALLLQLQLPPQLICHLWQTRLHSISIFSICRVFGFHLTNVKVESVRIEV